MTAHTTHTTGTALRIRSLATSVAAAAVSLILKWCNATIRPALARWLPNELA